jgi:glycosyltransferase involved in cell wall biosynthesis
MDRPVSIKKASHILAISNFTRNDITTTYKIAPSRVTATPLGYKKSAISYQPSDIKKVKKKYKIKGDYLLFLGTLKPSKNIEGLLEAFRLLVNKHSQPITLVIAGKKGWLYETIFERVKKLGLEKKVIFTGFVPDQEAPILIVGAQAFVLPSFWEGFGIPALEAMTLGTPVVASNVASLPEVVGKAGILVDPHDPADIARGANQALKEREKRVKIGLIEAQKFSWQHCAQQTLKILKKVAQDKPNYDL